MAAYIKQIHETKRPLIITQRGKSAAVLVDVQEFEAMQEKIELLSDVHSSLHQLEKGEGVSHSDAKDILLKQISKGELSGPPLAIDRASEIAEYIALDNLSAAKRWIEDIFKKVDQLKSFPRIGRVVPEISDDEFRELIYGNYRIIYRIEAKQISILTVRHGKQILPIDEIKT